MRNWAPLWGDSFLSRYQGNVNAYILINSSVAILQDSDYVLGAIDVFTAARDIHGDIMSFFYSLVSKLRS